MGLLGDIDRLFCRCTQILHERSSQYGSFKGNLVQMADEVTVILSDVNQRIKDPDISDVEPMQVALILASLKWIRIKKNKYDRDSYIDMINYLAAAVCLLPDEEDDDEDDIVSPGFSADRIPK